MVYPYSYLITFSFTLFFDRVMIYLNSPKLFSHFADRFTQQKTVPPRKKIKLHHIIDMEDVEVKMGEDEEEEQDNVRGDKEEEDNRAREDNDAREDKDAREDNDVNEDEDEGDEEDEDDVFRDPNFCPLRKRPNLRKSLKRPDIYQAG